MRSTQEIQAENNSDKKNGYSAAGLILMTIAGAIGGLSVGYEFGIVGGVLLYIEKDFPDVTLE